MTLFADDPVNGDERVFFQADCSFPSLLSSRFFIEIFSPSAAIFHIVYALKGKIHVKIHDIRIVDRRSNRMVVRGIADSMKVCNQSELSSYVNVPVDNVYYAWILFSSRLI